MVSLSGLLFTCAHTKMSLLKTCKNKKASDETNLIKFSVQEELPESSAPTVHPTSSERGVEGWNIPGAPGPERLGTLAPPERVRGAACLGEWVPELSVAGAAGSTEPQAPPHGRWVGRSGVGPAVRAVTVARVLKAERLEAGWLCRSLSSLLGFLGLVCCTQ